MLAENPPAFSDSGLEEATGSWLRRPFNARCCDVEDGPDADEIRF